MEKYNETYKETLKKIIKEELEAVTTETFDEGIDDNFYGCMGTNPKSENN